MAKVKKINIEDIELPIDAVRELSEDAYTQIYGKDPYGTNFPEFMGFCTIMFETFRKYSILLFNTISEQQ